MLLSFNADNLPKRVRDFYKILLSFHRNCHYNAVVDPKDSKPLLTEEPGIIEQYRLELATEIFESIENRDEQL